MIPALESVLKQAGMRFQDQLYLRIETSLHLPLTSVAIQTYHKSRKISITNIRFWWHILSPTANISHQLRFGLLVIWCLTSPLISNTKTDKNSSDSCLAMSRITWMELTFVISLFSSMKLNESVLRSSSAYGHVTEINMNSRDKYRQRYEPDIVMAVWSPILSTDTSCSVFLMKYHDFPSLIFLNRWHQWHFPYCIITIFDPY